MSALITLAFAAYAALDMNDVSILMPLDARPELLQVLPHLGETNVYPWTEEQRNAMLSQISPNIPPVQDAVQDFVLTSLRIDPCANRLALAPADWQDNCEAEFRVVWQKTANGHLVDSNIHTIYALTRAELADVLSGMDEAHRLASIDTKGQALAPQPVIAAEGASSAYLRTVLGLVQTYAKTDHLKELAHMVANTDRNWTLGHVGVSAEGPLFMAIPTMGQDGLDIVNVNQTINTPEGSSLTVHTYGKNGDLKTNGLLASKDLSGDLKRELDFFPILNRTIEAFAVENPLLFTPKTINCSTCHTAEKLKAGYDFVHEVAGDKIWASKFQKPTYAYPKDGKGLVARTPDQGYFLPLVDYGVYAYQNEGRNLAAPFANARQRSMQMFSFSSTEEPVIATRVVNDTAMTLDVIRNLFPAD